MKLGSIGLGLGRAARASQKVFTTPLAYFGSSLKLWIDPSDTASITHSSGLVDQINDKSGNGNHATGTTTTRPTTGTTTINGLNTLDFGAAHNLTINDDPDFDHNATGFTIICVAKWDLVATTGLRSIINKFGSAGSREYWMGNLDGTNGLNMSVYTDGTNAIAHERNILTDATARVFWMRYGGANTKPEFGFNRAPAQLTSASNRTITESATPIRIGSILGTGSYFDGKLGEVLYINRKITSAEMDAVMNYIGNKWGVPAAVTDKTLFLSTGGQSNCTNGWSTTAPYNADGIGAFNTAIASGFTNVEILRNAESGKPVMQVSSDGNHWVGSDLTDGPYLTQWISQMQGYVNNYGTLGDVTKCKAMVWAGCEGDYGQNEADFKASLNYLFDRFVAETRPDLKIFVVLPGRLTGSYPLYQQQRSAVIDMINEHPNAVFGADAFDLPLQDFQHYSPAGQATLWGRLAQRVLAEYGYRSSVGTLGPIISSATYSGSTVTAYVDLDGGAAISGSDVNQFRIEDDGVAVTINSFSISGSTITFNLGSSITAGSVVKLWCNYANGSGVVTADLVKDSTGMVMRSVKELSVSQA